MIALIFVCCAPLVAFAQEGTPEPEATAEPELELVVLPEVDPFNSSGDIIIAGSSTVFPITNRMARRFAEDGYSGDIIIDSIGTGGGFERFCVAGDTDISNASRAIREEERELCREINRNPVEFRVGTDALVVVVSADNTFVTDVTREELALLFSVAERWSDVRAEWPDQQILRFIPGTDSGTFDYFVEEIFNNDESLILSASNNQLSEDDNVLVTGVISTPYAIGFFGFAYYNENTDLLKPLSIEGIAPTEETAESGEYPLARPLFIYSDANIMQSKPQVADFINYYLTRVNEEILDVGYFPPSVSALNQARINWLVAMGLQEPEASDEE